MYKVRIAMESDEINKIFTDNINYLSKLDYKLNSSQVSYMQSCTVITLKPGELNKFMRAIRKLIWKHKIKNFISKILGV